MIALSLLQQEYFPSKNNRVLPEDFFVLAAHCTGKSKTFLLAHPEYLLTPETETALREALKRRLAHEPVAYITGQKEFYGRNFFITHDTLVPRPETELLVEEALGTLTDTGRDDISSFDIIDVGTGSGNIILSIALECEKMFPASIPRYTAIDISKPALDVAQKNAASFKKKSPIQFLQSDLLSRFHPTNTHRHLLVIANLPYLSTTLWEASMTDVRLFEPKSALESGSDGLDHYRRLLRALHDLRTNYSAITFLLEISPEQDALLTQHIRTLLPQAITHIRTDLSGKSRLVQGVF